MQIRKYGSALPAALLLSGILYPLDAGDNLKFGKPACPGTELNKQFFVTCHDSSRKIPVWVGYALTREDLAGDAQRKNMRFKADPELPRGQRAETADYANTATVKYDKGHMAPAADFKRSVEAMRATFVLSNAVPQKHGVNAGRWGELEDAVRKLAASRGAVWVFSGPVFVGGKPLRNIGVDKVAVPTHTYKVILAVNPAGAKEMFAFVMPNLDKLSRGMDDYELSVNEVEQLTGLDFFSGLPSAEQEQLEAEVKKLTVQ